MKNASEVSKILIESLGFGHQYDTLFNRMVETKSPKALFVDVLYDVVWDGNAPEKVIKIQPLAEHKHISSIIKSLAVAFPGHKASMVNVVKGLCDASDKRFNGCPSRENIPSVICSLIEVSSSLSGKDKKNYDSCLVTFLCLALQERWFGEEYINASFGRQRTIPSALSSAIKLYIGSLNYRQLKLLFDCITDDYLESALHRESSFEALLIEELIFKTINRLSSSEKLSALKAVLS